MHIPEDGQQTGHVALATGDSAQMLAGSGERLASALEPFGRPIEEAALTGGSGVDRRQGADGHHLSRSSLAWAANRACMRRFMISSLNPRFSIAFATHTAIYQPGGPKRPSSFSAWVFVKDDHGSVFS